MDLNLGLGLGLRAIGLSYGIEHSVRFMSLTKFKSPKFKSPKFHYTKTWLRLMKYMSLAEIRGFLGRF